MEIELASRVDAVEAEASYAPIQPPAGIDALPNELLSEIFSIGATSPDVPRSYYRDERIPFALLVSRISRRWRDTAISSGSLWNQLHLTAHGLRSDHLHANVYLSRSGTQPLDITIDEHQATGLVLQLVLPHCARWRTLYVRLRSYNDADLDLWMSSIRNVSVPLLQHFSFKFEGRCESEDRPHTPSFIMGAPSLTVVKLRGLCLQCAPPLTNLTSFRFDSETMSITQSQLQSIVNASPALRVLQLRMRGFEPSGTALIDMPCLRDLSLNFKYSRFESGLFQLFALLVAPALESLELVNVRARGTFASLDALHDLHTLFLRFPGHPLPETLILSSVHASIQDTILRVFPTVVNLCLIHTSSEARPTLSLLPCLESIAYNISPPGFWEPHHGNTCVQWLYRHVRAHHGTPRAMRSVRVGALIGQLEEVRDPGAKEMRYRNMRKLVDFEELPGDAQALQDSWGEDRFEYQELGPEFDFDLE